VDDAGSLWPGPPLLSTRAEVPKVFARFDGKNVVAIDDHTSEPSPLRAMVLLDSEEDQPLLEVETVDGAERIRTALSQVRSSWVLPGLRERRQLPAAAALANRPLGRVRFRKGRHTPDQVATAILEWLESAA
jgi:hypothetical protein